MRLARENPAWGYCRIRGELRKVGAEISTTSIRRILAVKPRPPLKRETWRQFMRTQASSIVACDLFTVESIRLKTLHVLFFIDLHLRRVHIGGVTDGPANAPWCAQIARNLSEVRERRDQPIRYLVQDRDKRFSPSFDEVFRAEGIEILRTPWLAQKANAYAERFIRTVRTECLDRILVLGERHLRSVLEIYIEHYNGERPHRRLDLQPPDGPKKASALTADDSVQRRDLLGGFASRISPKSGLNDPYRGTSQLRPRRRSVEFEGRSAPRGRRPPWGVSGRCPAAVLEGPSGEHTGPILGWHPKGASREPSVGHVDVRDEEDALPGRALCRGMPGTAAHDQAATV
ncbi:MAG: integrase core domain-containing protein [Acidimicrobiales bacterium]